MRTTHAATIDATAARIPLTTTSGIGVGVTGLALIGLGIWARREVSRALARERVSSIGHEPNTPVTSAAAARSMAELIRTRTLTAAGGRTYSETDEFLGGNGTTTSDATAALKDERTGEPIENPEHALWLQSMTLQTALMQAYLAGKIADLTIAIGAALVTAGVGITAAGAARR